MTEENKPEDKKPELPKLPEGFKMIGEPIHLPYDKIDRGWDDVSFEKNPDGTLGALGVWAKYVAFGFPLAYFRKAYVAFIGLFSSIFLMLISIFAIFIMPITMLIYVVGSFFYALFGNLSLGLSDSTVQRTVKKIFDQMRKDHPQDKQD